MSRNQKEMAGTSRGEQICRIAPFVLVLLSAAAVISPSLFGEFLNWDDDRFVVENSHVSTLSIDNIVHAFSGLRFESYQPLHLLSYMVDGALWRHHAPLYRIHNLVLYLFGVFLLHQLLLRLQFGRLPSVLGALFFAVAPYRIESVAWISCRKDVLMLVFLLISWHVHLSSHTSHYKWWLRGGAAMLFMMALLSKSSALLFPGMAFTVDLVFRGKTLRSALRGVALYVPPALVLGGALPFIWSDASLIRSPTDTSVLGRVMLVGWTLFHYGTTVIWPFHLSPIYAAPGEGEIREGLIIFGLAATVGIAVLLSAWKKGRSIWKPTGIIAVTLLPLLPFLNIIPLYYLAADRYLLLPSIGLALGLAQATQYAEHQRMLRLLLVLVVPFLLAMGGMAAIESTHWQDSAALWRHAVQSSPSSYYARLKYGETLRKNGNYAQSVRQYRKAKGIRPLSPLALGGVFWGALMQDLEETTAPELGSPEKAVARFLSIANDGPQLQSFSRALRSRGLNRAADVVDERIDE